MEKEIARSHIKLHVIVFVLGFTAVLGKLISISAFQIVWWRMLIAAAALFIMLLATGKKWLMPAKAIMKLAGIGFVVALHWISFFYAIKVSNISVTLSVLSVTTLFTGILEPVSQKRRIVMLDIIFGLVIIGGIYLIYQFESQYMEGILFSLLSSALACVFSVMNKNISLDYNHRVIAFWEMLSGFLTVTVFLLLFGGEQSFAIDPGAYDLICLLILGVVCTAFAFAETVSVMKKLSAYVVVLAINLETIYGILAGFIIFGDSERMTAGFYAGALIILLAVFLYPVVKRKFFPG